MIFLIVYPFLIYPLVLKFLQLFISKKINKDPSYQPDVTFLLPAYNEEDNIIECIRSIEELDYPRDKIKIIVGSDGSTDKTNTLVDNYIKNKEFIRFIKSKRVGKNKLLNKMIDLVDTETVYFLDVDMRVKKNALNVIMQYLGDNEIGFVLTPLKVISHDNLAGESESGYQKFENFLRKNESKISSNIASLGNSCIKTELIDKIPDDLVCDDFYFLLNVLEKKKRSVVVENLFTDEVRGKTLGNEFNRRVRIVSCSVSSLWTKRSLFKPSYGFIPFFLFSHKVVRWLSLVFLFIAMISSLFLDPSGTKNWILLAEYMFIVITYSAFVFQQTDVKLPLIGLPLFYVIISSSFILGIFRFFSQKQNAIWTTTGLAQKN